MSDVVLYILALFLPPVSVFLKRGFHGDFWINILLTIIGWIPGVLHAWYIITKYERPALRAVEPKPVIGATAPRAAPPVATAPPAATNGTTAAYPATRI